MSAAAARVSARARRSDPAALVAANLSLLAAVVHVWLAPSAARDWWAYAAFFLGTGLAQAAFTVLVLVRPGTLVYQAGIWTNVVVVATYAWSRSVGIPMGPLEGVVEPVAILDLATTAAEMALVVVAVTQVRGRARSLTIDALLLVGLAAWAGRVWLVG